MKVAAVAETEKRRPGRPKKPVTQNLAAVKRSTGRPRKITTENPTEAKPKSRFVRIEDVANFLGVGIMLVRRMIASENFPAHKISTHTVVFDLDEIALWVKAKNNRKETI